ncbi:response regulator [Paenibacillus sp. GSMTC-2017]|uniref:response regulator transcription factor n=1 Tax=Paenibacillus sp. GSMTC-2017 TaxID=2794350 RepID=UPI0018D75E63|nr:response regulator [Paenibacillus sp. GSMTC-2017]MBH5320404.1 response regulator [Paenibacillus sp. GSMTC-2017]
MYKLLIVDDEPLTRQYIRSNLSALHNEWICTGEAADGREALELIDGGASFDLIMTDIKMPVMTGIELARELSRRHPRPRMIIVSGYDEFSLAKEAMHYGVHDYLLKPLVREELVAVLDTIASELSVEQVEQTAYQSLVSLSEESRGQVARNALRAIVLDNNIEIKVLYPILHRLKISLIEAEGAIMIVDLDVDELLGRNLSKTDQALFRYILHQTASELIPLNPGPVLFIDNEQRSVILIPGENKFDVLHRCQLLFRQLSDAIRKMTGLHLWGAVGTSEIDLLQLNSSYLRADKLLKSRMLKAAPSLLCFESDNDKVSDEKADNQANVRYNKNAAHSDFMAMTIYPHHSTKKAEHETITKVKEYIHIHFAEPISLASIAEKMKMSSGYLSSLFHQQTDESYIKFLTRVRMEHAAELLRKRPTEKVYDVAEKVGYVSVKHFSYVFKGHYGMPPGEYQEKGWR